MAAAIEDRALTPEWAVPQAVIGLPQYFVANLLLGISQGDEGELRSELSDFPELPLLLLLPAMLSTAITFHGATSAIAGDDAAFLNASFTCSFVTALSTTTARSTIDTLGVGTRMAHPFSLPLSSGMTSPMALAAPVVVGIIDWPAARARRRSL